MNIKSLTENQFQALTNFEKYDLIKEAFLDLLDDRSSSPFIMQEQTGLSFDRCLEIHHLFTLVQTRGKHNDKHKIAEIESIMSDLEKTWGFTRDLNWSQIDHSDRYRIQAFARYVIYVELLEKLKKK